MYQNPNWFLRQWGDFQREGFTIVIRKLKQNIDLIDLRISQLAPTDLRGIPVPAENKASWYPPDFLPTAGKGILFLDEINMAPPAVQGIAQQLILDRKVGSYQVPDGWFIWSAGNRKEDFAAVFDMPAPLANRFIHIEVKTSLDEFKKIEPKLNNDVLKVLNLENSVNSKKSYGGTSFDNIKKMIMKYKKQK